ncbi:hypothetical protein, partial [Proteus mirabilis]|uniref:hypothetical protein n=1 Tax=Proteus mirabilis TaxID=584 RepID=UPI001C8A53D6
SKLYQSENCEEGQAKMESCFRDLKLPGVTPEQQSFLNAPLSEQEVQEAVRQLQSGKVPGPDGFPSELD